MEDEAAYRREKEAFYTGHTGGSTLEVLAITAVVPVAVLSTNLLALAIAPQGSRAVSSVLGVLGITLPLHLALVAPDHIGYIIAALLLSAAGSLVATGCVLREPRVALADLEEALNAPRKPFVATYRGGMMLATILAILAVDFRNFERRLAKTETFGVSLMDAGVGSVLLSQAVVSPLVRRPATPMKDRVRSALLSASPLLAIGLARLAGTRAADYHGHASECAPRPREHARAAAPAPPPPPPAAP